MQQAYWRHSAVKALGRALLAAGAVWGHIYRQPTDANGVPTGAPELLGCVYGMLYTRGQTDLVTIAMPGVVMRTETTRLIGLLCGCAAQTRTGDILHWRGTQYKILHAETPLGMALMLVLDDA